MEEVTRNKTPSKLGCDGGQPLIEVQQCMKPASFDDGDDGLFKDEDSRSSSCDFKSTGSDLSSDDSSDSSLNSDENNSPQAGSKRKRNKRYRPRSKQKHRRRKAGTHHPNGNQRSNSVSNYDRNMWRPYSELSWDERNALAEQETLRATAKREKRMANGQPMAPYNTTQFLMDQSNEEENDDIESLCTDKQSDEEELPCVEKVEKVEEAFLEKEFTEDYMNYHTERLQKMPKLELVKEFVELQTKMELIRRERNNPNSPKRVPPVDTSGDAATVDASHARDLEEEIRKLRQENSKLVQDNQHLRQLSVSSVDTETSDTTL